MWPTTSTKSTVETVWKGSDKVRGGWTISEYGEGGLKMIDPEIKSLRLAWLKGVFNGNDGTWKRYLNTNTHNFVLSPGQYSPAIL